MSLLILLSVFLSAASVMYLVYRNFPELNNDEKEKMKIPKDMEDAKALGTVLSKYKDTYYTQRSLMHRLLANTCLSLFPFSLSLSGVAPPSFVAINAGTTLYKLTTAGEAVSWNSLFVLGILAVLSILPVCFQKKLQQKLE
ncbi:UNVERIFIED_CONTAM: hypothetical protein FKN15_044154 [Acipenser sinensis]